MTAAVAAPVPLAVSPESGRAATPRVAWRAEDGSWHWDPDHLRFVRILGAIEPSPPPACDPPQRVAHVLLPPSPAEVRGITRALATATTWTELLRLAQRIWDYPIAEYHAPAPGGRMMPSARAQLCDAYHRGVERLWGKHAPSIDLFHSAAGRPKRVAA